MRKATLHISNNQASVSITMPSTPHHKRKDSNEHRQPIQSKSVNLPTSASNQNIIAKNVCLIESKSLTSPRSPSPLYENEQLNPSNHHTSINTTSFRYPSQSLVMSQAALSSNLSTTMSNVHLNQPQQQSTTNQQLMTQQDLEEEYFATIESSVLASAFQNQNQRQKSSRGKPKLLRQAHAELMELPPRVTRDRLPSATPSSFSNYSGTCGFSTNYTAGLTPPFTPNQAAYFDQTGELQRTTSNYYSYFEDANSFVAQKAIATASAQAAAQSSNNPVLRNLALISSSQSSQPHSQLTNPSAYAKDFREPLISDNAQNRQQNSMNTGRLATEINQNEVDSSFEFLDKLVLRCRSVPLLAIYIKSDPGTPENEELNLVIQQKSRSKNTEKELITFIDFLNENTTQNEKMDQIIEQPVTTTAEVIEQPDRKVNVKLEKLCSEEEGYTDVESEIMSFSNRQQTVIKREPTDDQSANSVSVEHDDYKRMQNLVNVKAIKEDFLIESHHQLAHQYDKFEEKENRSPISGDGLELEEVELEDDGEHISSDRICLLPSTPSTYSLFQKLMSKHNGAREGSNSNQNTFKKHSSDIESRNRSSSLVNCNTAGNQRHRHRRKQDYDSLVVSDILDDQSNQQTNLDDLCSQRRIFNASRAHKNSTVANEKQNGQSKKIKDKQTAGVSIHRSKQRAEIWSDMPNSEESMKQQQIEFIKNEHIQTSNSLPSSRSMQFCQANSYDQGNDPNYLITSDRQQGRLNTRSNSKESIKSPKIEKKKRKFSKKALHLLKVNRFHKSKSEETGKELESLGLASKTLAAVCKARSYNYNLIKNVNEYNLSQQSSVFNSANNSYEENYHITKPTTASYYMEQQSMPSHLNSQQCQHSQFLKQQKQFNSSLGQIPSNLHLHHSALYDRTNKLFDTTKTNQPLMNNDQTMNDDRLFAVHVHNTDRKLKSSKGIENPFVKMHVVNLHTGEYLHTSEFIYQSSTGLNAGLYMGSLKGKEYIQPITTQPCDLLFKFRYPKNPFWEELLILNESYSYLRQNDVILFFEVLDYVCLEHSDLLGSFQMEHLCYRVGWGYFLLNNLHDQFEYKQNQTVKLQLYKPYMHTVEKSFEPYCQIFNWWKNYKRIQYSSSLFLTLTTVSIHELSDPKHPIHLRILNKSLYKQYLKKRRPPDYNWMANENLIQGDLQTYPNKTIDQFQQLQTNNSSIDDLEPSTTFDIREAMAMQSGTSTFQPSSQQPSVQKSAQLSNWYKSSAGITNSRQHCKLPSSTWHQLSAGNNKCCYNVAFSNDGTKIACCASVFTAYMSTEKRSSIFIYDIPGGNFLQRVNGFHSAPIYYLDWSRGDKLLASASADCTCLVWQMRRAHCAPLILNHPCFVYTVKFHPTNHYLLATGAFDGGVRIWCLQESLKSTIKEPILLQCVVASGNITAATFHGQVLALCWMSCLVDYIGPNGPEQKSDLLLFSGCSRGNLMALKQDDLSLSWLPHKKMKIKEIMNIAINEIHSCPNSKLILFCRDGVQRMVDIFSESITMRYIGSLNFNHLIRGCISTDGRFLFAGSEDAIVHVWNVQTGERIYTYNNLPFRGSIASIHYHPFDDIIAISGLNARTISVCLYKHPDSKHPPSKRQLKINSDPNYLPTSMASSTQVTAKASMVIASNQSGHTTVSFAGDKYKQEEFMLTNKSTGSLGTTTIATERTSLTKTKPELKKSHTIDHGSNASMPSRANQKVQKAMKKLELALRLSFNEKS